VHYMDPMKEQEDAKSGKSKQACVRRKGKEEKISKCFPAIKPLKYRDNWGRKGKKSLGEGPQKLGKKSKGKEISLRSLLKLRREGT